MNEKQKDRAIEALKEINEILKETNLEMERLESKRYVLYSTKTKKYVKSHYSYALSDFENAEIFSMADALGTKTYLEYIGKMKENELKLVEVKVIKGE